VRARSARVWINTALRISSFVVAPRPTFRPVHGSVLVMLPSGNPRIRSVASPLSLNLVVRASIAWSLADLSAAFSTSKIFEFVRAATVPGDIVLLDRYCHQSHTTECCSPALMSFIWRPIH
jgi:hypothetical protein